jgi:protein-S-isoprenylcysteine O-methyltransferase Ste14
VGPAAPAPAPTATRQLAALALAAVVLALDVALLALGLGGLAALRAHPPALGLVAVYALTGVPLALLRPARAQDVIERAPDPRGQLLALLLIPLLLPAISAYGEHTGLGRLGAPPLVAWLGVGLAGCGLGFRIVAMMTLGPRFAPVVALQRQHPLETRGPYRLVRHPGYLGAWLASLGAMLVFRDALGTPLLALFAWLLAERARREDAVLERHFGDAYRAYERTTGAFLPRLPGRRHP